MAFTEVEMAILSQAAYLELPDSAENKPLYDFLNENKDFLTKKLGDGYSEAIDSLLKKVEGKDYNLVHTRDDKDGSGFAAFAVSDPSGGVTVACRGTEGFDIDSVDSQKDMIADAELTISLQTSQQKEMEKFVRELERYNYNSYSFTGHSLGGNLAMYGAICLSNPDKLGTCVTFNAPGFNSAFLRRYAVRISRIEDRMISFQNERDCVSEAFNVPGKVIVLECDGWDFLDAVGIDAHGLNTLVPNKDGSFQRNHTGKKDTTILGYLLDKGTGLSDDVMGFFSPLILSYDFLKWRQKEAQVICRDFSLETKEMLLDVAKETEEEKWWQISRWDCWYKVDKFFGGLAADWDRYSGNIDTYYRKLIDMNDSSAKDIKKIFEKVYEIDSNYASNIRAQKDALSTNITAKLKEIRDSICPKVIENSNYSFPTNRARRAVPKKSNPEGRSADAYNEVLDSFDVEHTSRYQKEHGNTWCNIYVWDVTSAMNCEIPHWVYQDGTPAEVGAPGAYELNAAGVRDWLAVHGQKSGWKECTADEAIQRANSGQPTVACDTRGAHVAMVAPQRDGERGVQISQAGANNYNHRSINYGWDSSYQIKYYYHE